MRLTGRGGSSASCICSSLIAVLPIRERCSSLFLFLDLVASTRESAISYMGISSRRTG